ncbi:MAG TPA: hypothetical protein VGL59_20145, partial [Polyangia bacterium]
MFAPNTHDQGKSVARNGVLRFVARQVFAVGGGFRIPAALIKPPSASNPAIDHRPAWRAATDAASNISLIGWLS